MTGCVFRLLHHRERVRSLSEYCNVTQIEIAAWWADSQVYKGSTMELVGKVVCLLLLFNFLTADCSQVHTWRYHSATDGASYEAFSTGEKIILEHFIANPTLQWEVASDYCRIEDKSASRTSVVCTEAGSFPVYLKQQGSDEMSYAGAKTSVLNIKRSPYCYKWQMLKTTSNRSFDTETPTDNTSHAQQLPGTFQNLTDTSDSVTSNTMVHVKVWIVPMHGPDGHSGDSEPNQESMFLGSKFTELGLLPTLHYRLNGFHLMDKQGLYLGYNTSGWWEFLMETDSRFLPEYVIMGQHVSLYDCFIKDTYVTIPVQYPSLNENQKHVGIVNSGDVIRLLSAPCIPTTAVLLSRDKLWMTQDGFKTTEEMLFPEIIQSSAVQSLVISSSGLRLLTDDSRLYSIDYTLNRTEELTEAIHGTIIGLAGRDWCSRFWNVSGHYEEFLVWTKSRVYLHLGREVQPWRAIDVPVNKFKAAASMKNPQIQHQDVVFGYKYGHLGIIFTLMEAGLNKTGVATFNWIENEWQAPTFFLTTKSKEQQIYRLLYLNSGQGDHLLWTQGSVYYSYNKGTDVGVLSVQGTQETKLTMGSDDVIIQIISNYNGDILILTKNMQLYYGKTKHTEVVKLDAGEDSPADCVLWCDGDGSVYKIQVLGKSVIRTQFPLWNELHQEVPKTDTCPYLSLTHSLDRVLYQMDKGESVTMWTHLSYPIQQDTQLQVFISGESLLQVHASTQYDYSSGVNGVNKTLVFALDGLHSYTGLVTVEFYSHMQNLACPRPAVVSGQIIVGCPRHRQIKIATNDTQTCSPVHNYTIPSVALRSTGDKVVNYDFEDLGCPIRIHKDQGFIPQLILTDQNMDSKLVDANFVVWEEHGRTDFTYNTTMRQAGCRRRADTWDDMRARVTNSTVVGDVWTPQDYRSCFEESYILEELDRLYEILNSSSNLSITFPENRNGIFIFHAKVIDPSYSFCQLETRFAVEVYGAIPDRDLTPMLASFVSIVGLALILFVILYLRFRQHVIEELAAYEMMKISSFDEVRSN